MSFIDDLYRKYNTAESREQNKYEKESYWNAVVRNVAPATIEEHPRGRYVLINGTIYKRCLIAGIPPMERINGYPINMSENMISRLMELSTYGNQLSISHKITPIEDAEATKMIQNAIFINEVKQHDSKKSNVKEDNKVTSLVDENLLLEDEHNKRNFRSIFVDNKRQFHSALIITMKSFSEEGLNALESDILSIMGSEGIVCEFPDYKQKQTFLSAQPYNVTPEYTQVQVLSPYAAILTPSRNVNSNTDNQGLFFGYDRFTNKTIMVDVDALAAQHILWVGATGSGKTYTALLELLRARSMLNRRIIYCTPKADASTNHRAVVDYLGDTAELIDIGPNGHNINPLQILYDREQMGDDPNEYVNVYNNHKSIVTRFLDVWFEDTGSINMSNFIDYSLNNVYEAAGVYRDIPSTWHGAKWPVLNDLIAFWKGELVNADQDDRKTIKAVLNKTFSLGKGGTLAYMNNPTNIDLSKDFIIIDLSNTPDMIKDAMNVLVTGILGQRFRTDTKKSTIIAIDEARVFLQNPVLSKFLMTTLTQGRSAKIGLWLMTQQATDLKKGNVAEEFQTNIFLKIILGNNMTKDNVVHVKEYFNLDDTDVENLLSSGVGDGLLIVGDARTPVEFKPTQLENDIIKGVYLKNEKKELASECSDLNEIDECLIPIVMKEGYCLDKWAPESNVIQNWRMEPVANAFGAGLVTAWIKDKTPQNQSLDHFSTVVQIAGLLAINGAEDIKINHENDADVTFRIGEETYGIEYERVGSHTEEELQNKKFRTQSNYSNTVFVCASGYHKKLSKIIGGDFVIKRGQALEAFIESLAQ